MVLSDSTLAPGLWPTELFRESYSQDFQQIKSQIDFSLFDLKAI